MPTMKRNKTKYPGVSYVSGTDPRTGKSERIYYIRYRRDGKLIEEKAGRQGINDMTPARAAKVRADRMAGSPSNQDQRDAVLLAAEEEANRWTLTRLWSEYKSQKPDLKGLAQDESRWRRFIEPSLGDTEPGDLQPLDLDRLRLKLLKEYSPQHVKHTLALIRRLIRFGASKGLCDLPSFQITMPKVDNQKTEFLSGEQLERLLDAADKDPHPHAGTMIKLVLFTGMRKGELFCLRWKDIDLERGLLRIMNPKSGKSATIPLSDKATALLKAHRREPGSDYVFPGRDGKQRCEIRRPIDRIREASKLPKDFRPFHGLRHHFASSLANAGVDIHVIQKLLNHSDHSTTLRYSHLKDATLRQATELASNLI